MLLTHSWNRRKEEKNVPRNIKHLDPSIFVISSSHVFLWKIFFFRRKVIRYIIYNNLRILNSNLNIKKLSKISEWIEIETRSYNSSMTAKHYMTRNIHHLSFSTVMVKIFKRCNWANTTLSRKSSKTLNLNFNFKAKLIVNLFRLCHLMKKRCAIAIQSGPHSLVSIFISTAKIFKVLRV